MKSLLSLLVLFAAPCYGQAWSSPLDKWTNRSESRPLADLNAKRYDTNSLSNKYGSGSPYKVDGLNNPYSRFGSRYSNQSATNPYATNPPKIYGSNGTYHGELSANPYGMDSTSNPYSHYGSRYSPSSINNPYGAGSRYRTNPLYVYPGR